MSKILFSADVIAMACKGNPVLSVILVFLFYCAFTFLEAIVERLIFGARFEHWLDPIFMLAFLSYSGLCVYRCAIFNR